MGRKLSQSLPIFNAEVERANEIGSKLAVPVDPTLEVSTPAAPSVSVEQVPVPVPTPVPEHIQVPVQIQEQVPAPAQALIQPPRETRNYKATFQMTRRLYSEMSLMRDQTHLSLNTILEMALTDFLKSHGYLS